MKVIDDQTVKDLTALRPKYLQLLKAKDGVDKELKQVKDDRDDLKHVNWGLLLRISGDTNIERKSKDINELIECQNAWTV